MKRWVAIWRNQVRDQSLLPWTLFALSLGSAAGSQLAFFYIERQTGDPPPWIPLGGTLASAVFFAVACRIRPTAAPPIGEASEWLSSRNTRRLLSASLLVSFLGAAGYGFRGFSVLVPAAWILSWILAAFALFPLRRPTPPSESWSPAECGLLVAVAALGVLLYLPANEDVPFPLHGDEILLVGYASEFIDGDAEDIFSVWHGAGMPRMFFFLISLWYRIFGTSLGSVRAQTAVVGILLLLPFYAGIRGFSGRRAALAATLLLATAHFMIAWNRVILHNNSPLLVAAIALAALAPGLRRHCPWRLFWGGIALGWGFYTYYAGQILIVVWCLFLVSAALLKSLPLRRLLDAAIVSFFGFLLAAAPMIVRIVADPESFSGRARALTVLNPIALDAMKQLYHLPSLEAALVENTTRALLAFTPHYVEGAGYYTNPGWGLADPATSALMVLGIGFACAFLRRPSSLFSLAGFGLVYLAGGFLIYRSPTGNRLLLLLPFACWLAGQGLSTAIEFATRSEWLRRASLAAALSLIGAWNVEIYWSHVEPQVKQIGSDAVTNVHRYLMRTPIEGRTVYLVAAESSPVLFMRPSEWTFLICGAIGRNRAHYTADPTSIDAPPPLTLLIDQTVWRTYREELQRKYPNLRYQETFFEISLLAVEIPP